MFSDADLVALDVFDITTNSHYNDLEVSEDKAKKPKHSFWTCRWTNFNELTQTRETMKYGLHVSNRRGLMNRVPLVMKSSNANFKDRSTANLLYIDYWYTLLIYLSCNELMLKRKQNKTSILNARYFS